MSKQTLKGLTFVALFLFCCSLENKYVYAEEQANDVSTIQEQDIQYNYGWVEEDGKWRYYTGYDYCIGPSYIYSDEEGISSYYLFDENGYLVISNWLYYNESWYYGDADGLVATGLTEIGSVDYYFNYDGTLATFNYDQIFTTDDKGYLIAYNRDGVVVEKARIVANDWTHFQDSWYFFDENLEPYEYGIHNVNGVDYFFYGNGELATYDWNGIQTTRFDGYLVAYNQDGIVTDKVLVEGDKWISFNNDWYYFDSNLEPYNGVQNIDGVNYYFYWGGRLATSDYPTTITTSESESYLVSYNGKGEVVEYVIKESNKWLYFNNNWYYYEEGMKTISGIKEIDGVTYYFNSESRLVNYSGSFVDRNNKVMIKYDSSGVVTDIKNISVNEWIWFDDTWYYFKDNLDDFNGVMPVDGVEYYFYSNRLPIASGYYIDYNSRKMYRYNDSGVVYETVNIEPCQWISFNGRWYYFDEQNNPCNGIVEIDGVKYYFVDGCLESRENSGFDEDNKLLYHYNSDGIVDKEMKIIGNEWILFDDRWYYFTSDLNKYSGLNKIGNDTYYFYYGSYIATDSFVYEGARRYFDSDGKMVTGWYQNLNEITKPWYYFNDDGKGYTGWLGDYYISDGIMATGPIMIDSKIYDFDSEGHLVFDGKGFDGWNYIDNQWYFYENGKVVIADWRLIDDQWYYFGYRGAMSKATVLGIANKYYVFGENGNLLYNSWLYLPFSETYTYANQNGESINGWQLIDGTWYYFVYNEMVNYNRVIDGNLQLFNSSGAWLGTYDKSDGWETFGNTWCYYKNSSMLKGWQLIDNNWYYFTSEGRAVRNTVYSVDGVYYLFDQSAKLTTGWYYITSESYRDREGYRYADENGVAFMNGWKLINNQWYYFDYGLMVTGLNEVNGTYYYFATSGEMLNINISSADGWHLYDNQWYYCENGKYVFSKWKDIEGKRYYFNYDGIMAQNTVSPIYVNYHQDHTYYYFKADGSLAINEDIYYNGTWHRTNSEGIFEI